MAELEKMRVLMVCRTMEMGGTEKVVLQLCEAFKDRFEYLAVASSGGINEVALSDMGVEHFKIPDIAAGSLKGTCNAISSLRNIVRCKSINVVHCHHRMAAFLSRIALPNVKRLVTAHNVFNDKKELTRFAYSNCGVAACGGRVEENLKDYYGIDDIALIPNSVKPFTESINPIPEIYQSVDGSFKIGFLGRFSEQKGAKFLIEAVNDLIKQGVPLNVYFAGEGELEEELKEQIAASGNTQNYYFLGRRSDSQNFLRQIDVCVIPSLWEGLPLVLLEALSVGTPVVATAVDGILDVIDDRRNGILVPPADSKALARGIKEILLDPELRQSVAMQGKKEYLKNYSFNNWVCKYEHFYKRTV